MPDTRPPVPQPLGPPAKRNEPLGKTKTPNQHHPNKKPSKQKFDGAFEIDGP